MDIDIFSSQEIQLVKCLNRLNVEYVPTPYSRKSLIWVVDGRLHNHETFDIIPDTQFEFLFSKYRVDDTQSWLSTYKIDTYTFMFYEKEEDKGVADDGKCSHEHKENETGKKYLKKQWKRPPRACVCLFLIHTHWGISGETW